MGFLGKLGLRGSLYKEEGEAMPTPQAESRFSFSASARRAVSVLLTLALTLQLAGPLVPAGMQRAQAQPSSTPDPTSG